MKNVEETIISQYANSATIVQLIQNMNGYIDPRADIDNFYSFVWDVETAQGFGLDILGHIVGVGRVWQLPQADSYFGFQDGISPEDVFPFDDQGAFFDPNANDTQNVALSDSVYRTLILVKALSNISKATVPAINQLLRNIFAPQMNGIGSVDGVDVGSITEVDGVDVGSIESLDGPRCYANDLGLMTIRYTFEFLLTPFQFAIVSKSGVMLRPAGVSATMVSVVLPCFGFSEAGTITAAPFGQASFISENATNAVI